jgi:prevent-host-death family protein
MNVGIRELKAHLSSYLARARAGETVVITDHGKPVARIEPIRADLPEPLRRLVEEGRATDKGPMRYFPEPIRMTPGSKSSTDYVREQRR